VGGADGDQPDPGRDGLDHQPLGVHRDPDDLGPQGGQQPPRRPVPGRLHRDPVAGLQQHPGHQVDRLLGAVGDHHLAGAGLHRPGGADVAGDGLAQAGVAGRSKTVGTAIEPQTGRGRSAPPAGRGRPR
jgi:hypothetical protein